MIQLITSYFFEEPVHLNSFYIRKSDTMKQFWSHSRVQGKRMPDMPLYVLTSNYTFSGAEEFTYNLKNLKRATIIGETTGGGAHPVEFRGFPEVNVGMSLPFGRAVNPITGLGKAISGSPLSATHIKASTISLGKNNGDIGQINGTQTGNFLSCSLSPPRTARAMFTTASPINVVTDRSSANDWS